MVVGEYEVDALLDAEGSFITYAEGFPDATDDAAHITGGLMIADGGYNMVGA